MDRRWTQHVVVAATLAAACDNEGQARAIGRAEFEPRQAESTAPSDDPNAEVDVGADAVAEPVGDQWPDAEPLPEEPAPPVAPEDYGMIKPSSPPPTEDQLTHHGLAGYEVVAIYDRPDIESPKLGYLRIGTRMRVTDRVEGPGCSKGWHGLPQGGFACVNKGLVVQADRPPFMQHEPPAPRLDEPFPYDYAYVKRWNSPMWWRVPTKAELEAAESYRDEREALRTAPEATASATDKPAASTKPAAASAPKPNPASKLPSVDDSQPAGEVAAATPAPGKQSAVGPPSAPAAPPQPERLPLESLPLKLEDAWLERGFYVSLGEKFSEAGHAWWRTARGAYVDATHAVKYAAKDFAGVELAPDVAFPFGFVMTEDAKAFELQPDNRLKQVATMQKRTFVDLSDEIEISGKSYMMTADGRLLKKSDLRLAEPQPMPAGLQPWERWIDVSLGSQMLVAYEGPQPVFITLVSSGKKGTRDEPLETPTGRWRIRSKHVSTTMDGPASDGNYSIQDVPWTMFFEGNYALHGAFWHQGFGRRRSHGCVNLGPSAARWLFLWSTPFLPEGWHGVHAHAGSPGTTIVVHE